jgi:Domain of unknown function (DUF1707)
VGAEPEPGSRLNPQPDALTSCDDMDHRPTVRIGDREREAVVEALRTHAAEGRLEPEEFEARVEAAYAARTRADLEGLTRDLPPLRSGDGRPSSAPPATLHPVIVRWGTVNVIVLAIWLATGDGLRDFWPKWVLLLSTVVVLVHIVGRRSP